ncbi:MAG: hypothetical protein ACI3XF_04285, partial [Eubacteriales bacterium]
SFVKVFHEFQPIGGVCASIFLSSERYFVILIIPVFASVVNIMQLKKSKKIPADPCMPKLRPCVSKGGTLPKALRSQRPLLS